MILERLSPERRLAAAILRRAVEDARSDHLRAAAARHWLQGEDAGILFHGLGIHPDVAREWLEGLEPVTQDVLAGLCD